MKVYLQTIIKYWVTKTSCLFRVFSAIGVIVLVVSCNAIEYTLNSRHASDHNYKETFLITDKKPQPKGKRNYYWFKSQKVQQSQNNYGGQLLNGAYTKYYYSNELAEKGNFKKGLKIATWTRWHKNGVVAQVSKWHKGIQHGKTILRDSLGASKAYGSYKKGAKHGYWVYPKTADTLYYYKGEVVDLKTLVLDTLHKPNFFKRTFNSPYRKSKKLQQKEKDTLNRSFFKQLFSKTNKTKDSGKTGFLRGIFKKKEGGVAKGKTKAISQKERENLVRSKQKNKNTAVPANSRVVKKNIKAKTPKENNKKKKKPSFLKRLFGSKKDTKKGTPK